MVNNNTKYLPGNCRSKVFVSGKRVIGPFIFDMGLLCPTHCSSSALILGLFRERLKHSDARRSASVKQVLHVLFRMVKKWSNAVDDANRDDIEEKDMPEIVIKFLPKKHVTFVEKLTDEELFEAVMQSGNAEWLENYDILQHMAIFFVMKKDGSNGQSEETYDDADDDRASPFPEFVNNVLIDIYQENMKRFEGTYNAHLKGTNKQGLLTAKKMLSEFHDLTESYLDTSGNRLDSEHCIDLSYVPMTSESMYRVFQSFLTGHKRVYTTERVCDAHVTLESLLTPSQSFREKMTQCKERYDDIDWERLLKSGDSGQSFFWNLNAPFVLSLNESDFTAVAWEHSVQPFFKWERGAAVEDFFEVEAADADDDDEDPGDVENEEEGEQEQDEDCDIHGEGFERDDAHAIEEELRKACEKAFESEEEDGDTIEDSAETNRFMLTSRANMSKRAYAHLIANAGTGGAASKRRRVASNGAVDAPRLTGTVEGGVVGEGGHISFGVFDPEGIIGECIKKQRELGVPCARSGLFLARIVMEKYWMNLSNQTKQLPDAQRRSVCQHKSQSLLNTLFMCVMCPRTTGLRLTFPMSDALATALKPLQDALDEAKYKSGRGRKTLQITGLPYNHANMSIGMHYVADWWAYLDKALHMECLHYVGAMLHLCFTSVYATPFDEYQRLPHVWMSGLHSVGKSFVVLNVADVSLPECMVEKVHRETQGACYISTMNNTEQLTTYKTKIYTETPLISMGISKYSKDTDANANLKARLVGEDVALKRSYRNENTNLYELEVLNPKIREQMTFVMNQPLYEVEPNVFTRGIPTNPSRLNRVETDLSAAAHETPCHKTLGNAYFISPDEDDESFEKTELQNSRQASTKELGVYGNTQAICEGNLRSRLFYFGALYQAAVRMRLLRGVDMLEVKGRHVAFSRVLKKIPLVTSDKLNRRLEDISSLAYTLTAHTAIWKVFASADSPFVGFQEFEAKMLMEVDKNAICSSAIALFCFSSIAKALVNEPMRMMLFYARYELLATEEHERQHPARETTPIESVYDAYIFDTEYYILSNTFHPKTPTPNKGVSKADTISQDHFIRRMLLFYQTPANARRYGKDTMTIEYAKSLLTEFISTDLFCIRDCVDSGKVQRGLCVNKNYIKLDGYTTRDARICDDNLTIKELVEGCFDANTRCQRLLLCDAATSLAGEQEVSVLGGVSDPALACRKDEGCACFRSINPRYPDGVVERSKSNMPLEDVAFQRRMVDMNLIERIPSGRRDPLIQKFQTLISKHHPTLCAKSVEKRHIDVDEESYPVSDVRRIVNTRVRASDQIASTSTDVPEWDSCLSSV
ncbi:hypothetical protein CYMTET_10820 [Cymbomonas tetramitiformis]|uniref:Uncharacterized protein n=1 Tax=Cymbomonas tetramitiformis TaxID=36881 RepID=A0AAE0LE40_9CHLO|nr:hypothetical protein CYMTET_10820 [Cymbomonas tetramitiformis]